MTEPRIMVFDRKTGEVYEANKLKIIADLRRHYNADEPTVIQALHSASIDNPIIMTDVEVWTE